MLAASVAVLLLANNPHGGEHLKELLVGQILWVTPASLPWVAAIYAAVLALAFTSYVRSNALFFYVIFALAVTISVQLVGLYLVFATLIVPALATRKLARHRLAAAYGVSAAGYVVGLAISAVTDLPSAPVIVSITVALAIAVFALSSRHVPDIL